jgi:hypothetical protein
VEYNAALKKMKEILTHASSWVRLENIMLYEISQPKEATILYNST